MKNKILQIMYKLSKKKINYNLASAQVLGLFAVSKSFTTEEIVNELQNCDTLDDAIIFFERKM